MVRVSEEVRAYLVKGHDPDKVKRLPGGGFFCFPMNFTCISYPKKRDQYLLQLAAVASFG
ncbi:hypothetical protein QFZ78_001161 [Paenibacillus sp. V4I5]|nr:hypothetical protein [Paenibacillus sp. V4I5]